MKRPNRDINIFGMSALDLFASALGAFILITLVLFPYFPNISSTPPESTPPTQDPEDLQACQSDLARTRKNLAQALEELQISQDAQANLPQDQSALQESQKSLQKAQEKLQQCAKELRKKFLLVLMSWSNRGDDVDLFIRDPQGNTFHYNRKTNSGTPAKFEEDNINGPGNEIWLHPQATPGKYEICYNYYQNRSEFNSVTVRGAYVTPAGRHDLGTATLYTAGQGAASTRHVASILIDRQGNTTLQRGSRSGTCGVTFGRGGK